MGDRETDRGLDEWADALEDVDGVTGCSTTINLPGDNPRLPTKVVEFTFVKGGNWRLCCGIMEDMMADHRLVLADVETLSSAKKTLTLQSDRYWRLLFPQRDQGLYVGHPQGWEVRDGTLLIDTDQGHRVTIPVPDHSTAAAMMADYGDHAIYEDRGEYRFEPDLQEQDGDE